MNAEELRKHILAQKDLKRVKMNVPEWGCDVWIQQLSGVQLDEWEQTRKDNDGNEIIIGLRAKLACWSLTDEEGNKLFTVKDIELLKEKNGAVFNRILKICRTMNWISDQDIEEIAKN